MYVCTYYNYIKKKKMVASHIFFLIDLLIKYLPHIC